MNKLNTEEYRLALGGSSNDDILNFNWLDKPHRLVYDLASECDANQQEIAELKQLAETKNARTLERIGRIERQDREIESLKKQISQLEADKLSTAAYAEQRINMLTRVNNKLREGKS